MINLYARVFYTGLFLDQPNVHLSINYILGNSISKGFWSASHEPLEYRVIYVFTSLTFTFPLIESDWLLLKFILYMRNKSFFHSAKTGFWREWGQCHLHYICWNLRPNLSVSNDPASTDYYSYFKLNVNFISTPFFVGG